MADVTIKVIGLAELRKALQGMEGKRLRKVTRKGLGDLGKNAKRRAKSKLSGSVLNTRTGKLKRSIDFDLTDTSVGVLVGKGGSAGVVWEFRKRDGPRRFLRPSMEEASKSLERDLIREWEREIGSGVA